MTRAHEPKLPEADLSRIPRSHTLPLTNPDGSWRHLNDLIEDIVAHRLEHVENPADAARSLGMNTATLHRARSDTYAARTEDAIQELKRASGIQ